MPDLAFGEFALDGLNAAPLDGEPVRVVIQALEEVKILFIEFVMAAGSAGLFTAGAFFPFPPVSVHIIPFDLVRRRRRAP